MNEFMISLVWAITVVTYFAIMKGREKIMNMYSVYDRVAQKFMGMFESINDGTATRAFYAACKTGQIAQEPEDYVLYKIGQFDEDKGTFANTLQKVCDGKPNGDNEGGK